MSIPPISAAVLAGGQSTRMGRDKALIVVDGQPVIQRVVTVLHLVSDDVRIIGHNPEYRVAGVDVIPDDAPGFGPVGGIVTALRHARYDNVLVVACDMPLLSKDLLLAMAGEPRTYDVLVPVLPGPSGEIRYEPLHAIYSRSSLPAMEALIASGDIRVQDVFKHLDARVLDEDWLRRHERTLEAFTNMNTPEDLERVRSRLAQRAGH